MTDSPVVVGDDETALLPFDKCVALTAAPDGVRDEAGRSTPSAFSQKKGDTRNL